MATYTPIIPPASGFAAVPPAAVDRLALAYGGAVFLSDDASPDLASAIPLQSGAAFMIAANRAMQVAWSSGSPQLRLMDY